MGVPAMPDNSGIFVLGEGAVLKGEVKSGRRVEVWGYLEGGITASEVVVQEGGKVFGHIRSDTAEVRGTLQGDARVQQLMSIKSTGSAAGTIKYGRLSMEEGGALTAHLRNIPPTIVGDLDLTVNRGGTIRITLADLNAADPDDRPEDLKFAVTEPVHGFVCAADNLAWPIDSFTQADLEAGRVHFAHDGSASETAKFDVEVTDHAGASSGPPRTVNVAVRD